LLVVCAITPDPTSAVNDRTIGTQARSFIMIEPMINRIEATQIAAGTVVGKFMPAPRISSLAQTWQLPSFDYLIIGPLK
jgi:hypothetical protein